jgi:hypothetical protein
MCDFLSNSHDLDSNVPFQIPVNFSWGGVTEYVTGGANDRYTPIWVTMPGVDSGVLTVSYNSGDHADPAATFFPRVGEVDAHMEWKPAYFDFQIQLPIVSVRTGEGVFG